MNLVFEKLGQSLAAGEKWVIGIAGTHFRLAECQWPVTVTLLRGNRVMGTMANMLAGDYFEDIEYDAIWVTNGALAQTVRCQLSGGGAGSDRVVGVVSVINGEVERVMARTAFIGYVMQAATAGSLSHTQIYNPAGSGKNLILSKGWGYTSLVTGIALTCFAAPVGVVTGVSSCKWIGGAAPVAELRAYAGAAMVGTMIGQMAHEIAGQSKEFPFQEPLMIPPGWGVGLVTGAANCQMTSTLQWLEEAA